MSSWIWLDKNEFPKFSCKKRSFCIAEFTSIYAIPRGEEYALRVCADARYELFVNGEFVGRGPVSAGGDFLEPKMRHSYYDEYELTSNGVVDIKLFVTSIPTVMCEYSFGQCGALVEILRGGEVIAHTDNTWKCRPVSARISDSHTDFTQEEYEYAYACEVKDIYGAKKSPIKHLYERIIEPDSLDKINLKSNEGYAEFDKIYSAYPIISLKTDGRVRVLIECEEIEGVGVYKESFIASRDVVYTSPRMRSVGRMKITLKGEGATKAQIENAQIIYSAYPVESEAPFKCSDKLLNEVYDICMHTLKICRRDLHLDSPTHQEPLACTGDYFIQALIEYFNIYDSSLTAFDIYRTAQMLEIMDGRIFHTTYSLIFAEWVYDYYMYTGKTELLTHTECALRALLARFDTYIGENGLVEKSPDYMFVDWILLDQNGNNTDPTNMMSHGNFEGYSLHHPPKALGQGVLCMFYYNALLKCAKIFAILGDSDFAKSCNKKAQSLKKAINKNLFDKKRGLYIGGLNTADNVPNGRWLPENTYNIFYLKQANTLAVLYGIAPEENRKSILKYVLGDLKKEEMQPYFYHFLLEALLKENMFEKNGLDLIRRYESLIERCDKGLCEAWEMFPSDCSHAWGGTPAYILKKALSGFEMVEAGYKKIKLSPRLYGLNSASLEIPTPYGSIKIKMSRGKKSIIVPDEIEVIE
ncbi:MAG: hypothetical protein E7622_02380 [Ruminococcaceae bacterium]|nr:hypothetical protein [Oscillospiraceae bacterium]